MEYSRRRFTFVAHSLSPLTVYKMVTTNSENATPENPTGGPMPQAGPALVRDGATVPTATEANPDEIKLSTGQTARLLNLRGDAVPRARRLVSELVDFQDALVSLSVLIDGRPIPPEELHAMPLKDALALHSAFNEKNG